MGLFKFFQKKSLDPSDMDDYKKFLQLIKDIQEGKVSDDLLNDDPSKRSLTLKDLDLLIKYGEKNNLK